MKWRARDGSGGFNLLLSVCVGPEIVLHSLNRTPGSNLKRGSTWPVRSLASSYALAHDPPALGFQRPFASLTLLRLVLAVCRMAPTPQVLGYTKLVTTTPSYRGYSAGLTDGCVHGRISCVCQLRPQWNIARLTPFDDFRLEYCAELPVGSTYGLRVLPDGRLAG